MIRFVASAAAVAFTLVLSPVSFASETKTAGVEEKAAEEDPVICKRRGDETGSRLGGSKVCKTKSEWEGNERAAKETMRELDRNGLIQPVTQNGG